MRIQNFDTVFPTKEAAKKCVQRAGWVDFMPGPAVRFFLEAIDRLELPTPDLQPIGRALMPNWHWMIRIVFSLQEGEPQIAPDGASFASALRWEVHRIAVPLDDDIPEEEAKTALAAHAEAISSQQ